MGVAIAGAVLIMLKALGNLEYLKFGAIIGIASAAAIAHGSWKLRQS